MPLSFDVLLGGGHTLSLVVLAPLAQIEAAALAVGLTIVAARPHYPADCAPVAGAYLVTFADAPGKVIPRGEAGAWDGVGPAVGDRVSYPSPTGYGRLTGVVAGQYRPGLAFVVPGRWASGERLYANADDLLPA